MWMTSIALSFLLGLSHLLGVSDVPSKGGELWTITGPWKEVAGVYVFEAESKALVEYCKTHPAEFIQFPTTVHGAHEIFLDSKKIVAFGDPEFRIERSFYGSPSISCPQLADGTTLRWRLSCYSRYFARFQHFPRVVKAAPLDSFFSETLNIAGSGSLFVIGLFILLIFWQKTSLPLTLSLGASAFFFSLYFTLSVAQFMGISISVLQAHRYGCLGIILGTASIFNVFRMYNAIPLRLYQGFLATVVASCVVILLGGNGDVVQFGTSIALTPTLLLLVFVAIRIAITSFDTGFEKRAVFSFLSATFFLGVSMNDILTVMGVVDTFCILPVGYTAGIVFFGLSVNEQINLTYKERDELSAHLEQKVVEKTKELSAKTQELEKTLAELKGTQAELVHSAKLASLGTLSAGIAHEINNSLNYVYGALKPIEKLCAGLEEVEKKEKILSLVKIMNEGLQFTFAVIRSLRNFTGLNQAKFNDISVAEVVRSVLTLLNSRLGEKYTVKTDVPPEIHVFGSVVALNQVFMNLITNALDAMPQGGEVRISASTEGTTVKIQVADNGTGIPADVRARIFDPFFTTKEVGKGTGLGLHMVKQEVDRHKGTIVVDSEVGAGTTFTIALPVSQVEQERLSA